MQDRRNSAENQRWKREVRQRDGDACRACGVQHYIHVHHIKPFKKYPEFATEPDNGITLCGNHHALLQGKEESTNLQTIIEAVSGQHDMRTADQLKRLSGKFCVYLDPLLKSEVRPVRNKAVYELFAHLQIYPDSLDQFLPLIQYVLDSENGSDEKLTKEIAVEFLKGSSSGAASQLLSEYERQIEFEKQKKEAEAARRRRDYITALKKCHFLADQGDTDAHYHLGWMYEHGQSVEQNDREAARWYRRAAQQGHVEAQYNLGLMYQYGWGHTEAVKWFQKAAQQGHAGAQYCLGFSYRYGSSIERNNREAVKWFQKAAEQGYAEAQVELGVMYECGNSVEQNNEAAIKWYQKAAEQGEPSVQYRLGELLYKNGMAASQDYGEAIKWFRKAAEQGYEEAIPLYDTICWLEKDVIQKVAEQGYASAQNELGVMYANGEQVTQDYEEAAKWYRKAAEQGHADAQNNLGKMYTEERGVDWDDVEAATWYRKAAEQGHADAQNNLGKMYEEGLGAEPDNEEAVKWYRKAAEQGHPNAQFHLGAMYEEGLGIEQNDEEALEWYFKAADQGDAYAQNRLGHRYEDGRGVVQDYREACRWYFKAADQCADDNDLRDGSLHDSVLYNALRLRDTLR